jgi:hypothetical protein
MRPYPLIKVDPLVVTDAMIVSYDVVETDYAAYAGGTTYAKGDRVIVVAAHTIYESVQAANVGHDPVTDTAATWWLKVSKTNRWKCLDGSPSTQTVKAGSMSLRVRPGQVVNSVFVLNALADDVGIRVIDAVAGTVYDKTTSLRGRLPSNSWFDWHFARRIRKTDVVAMDLPNYYGADILVDLTIASGNVAAGVIVMGYQQAVGRGVKLNPRLGITDYSQKSTNKYGDTTLVEGVYAKRAEFAMVVPNAMVDDVFAILAAGRAKPAVYVGSSLYTCTVVYGWPDEFEILIPNNTESDCSLSLKGLT